MANVPSTRVSWGDWHRRLACVALPAADSATTWRRAFGQGNREPIEWPTLAARAAATLAQQWALFLARAFFAARALVAARALALAVLRALVAMRAVHALVAECEVHALVVARALALTRRGHVKSSQPRRLICMRSTFFPANRKTIIKLEHEQM